MNHTVDVLICEDHPSVRMALQAVIDAQPDMTVAGIARDADEAIALAQRHRPALAIVGWLMPGTGPHAVRGIRDTSPHTKILAYLRAPCPLRTRTQG